MCYTIVRIYADPSVKRDILYGMDLRELFHFRDTAGRTKAHPIILCSKSQFCDFDPQLPQMGGASGMKILPNNLGNNIH